MRTTLADHGIKFVDPTPDQIADPRQDAADAGRAEVGQVSPDIKQATAS